MPLENKLMAFVDLAVIRWPVYVNGAIQAAERHQAPVYVTNVNPGHPDCESGRKEFQVNALFSLCFYRRLVLFFFAPFLKLNLPGNNLYNNAHSPGGL